MPPKIEVTLPCKLSGTQRRIYKQLQQKILFAHALESASSAQRKGFLSSLSGPPAFASADPGAPDSLVTLVMQFRVSRAPARTHTCTHAHNKRTRMIANMEKHCTTGRLTCFGCALF